jgi:hypothetical protein
MRFLGPDSIEDVFGPVHLTPGNDWPEFSYPRTDLHLNLGLGSPTFGMDFSDPASPHTFSSLDQYVSMLDLDLDGETGMVLDQHPNIRDHTAIDSTGISGVPSANTRSWNDVSTAMGINANGQPFIPQ